MPSIECFQGVDLPKINLDVPVTLCLFEGLDYFSPAMIVRISIKYQNKYNAV